MTSLSSDKLCFDTPSFAEDESEAAVLAAALMQRMRAHGKPVILFLSGEMGAGKTTFVRQMVQSVLPEGVDVASPTYALHHRYQLSGMGRHFDHWDLYRMKDDSELDGAGFWEMLEYEADLVAIEWPSLVPESHWPRDKEIWQLEIKKIEDSEKFKSGAGRRYFLRRFLRS